METTIMAYIGFYRMAGGAHQEHQGDSLKGLRVAGFRLRVEGSRLKQVSQCCQHNGALCSWGLSEFAAVRFLFSLFRAMSWRLTEA